MNNNIEREREFDEKCQELYGRYLNNFQITDEDILYHYTNFAGLKGILESKRFWFTDFRYLNDPSELNYSMGLIKNQINQFSKEHERTLWVLYSILQQALNVYVIGTISFCNRKDYLPAWRWYGGDGAGFTLGIKATSISRFDNANRSSQSWLFSCYNVSYGAEMFSDYLLDLLKIYSEYEFDPNFRVIFFSYLLPLLPQCKHDAYKEEHECRFVLFESNPMKNLRKINLQPPENQRGYYLRPNKKEINEFVNPTPTVISEG